MFQKLNNLIQSGLGIAIAVGAILLVIMAHGIFKNVVGLSIFELIFYFTIGGAIIVTAIEWIQKKIEESKSNTRKKSEGNILAERYWLFLVLVYISQIIQLIVFPVSREGVSGINWIFYPMYQIMIITIILSVLYGIYRKFKRQTFFHEDKRIFFAIIWRNYLYFSIIFGTIAYILALLTNTL
jgi:hypothetical protein